MHNLGLFARVETTTEVLRVVCVDGEHAWLKDELGNRKTHRVEDLERVSYSAGMAYLRSCAAVSEHHDFSERRAAE